MGVKMAERSLKAMEHGGPKKSYKAIVKERLILIQIGER